MSQQYSGLSTESALPPIYRRFHSSVSCDNSIFGCNKRFSTAEERLKHKELCEFEPNSTVKCVDCKKPMQRSELRRHNCIKELRSAIDELKDIITGLEEKVNQHMIHLNNAKQILDASPQIQINETQTDYWNQYDNRDNEPKHEVFESEPEVRLKVETQRLLSDSSHETDGPLSPEVSTYKRYNKSISEEAEFRMYGSLKYKYLSQLSREFSGDLPPIDYNLEESIESDLKKKNRFQLIDVIRENEELDRKPTVVRLRSWSERD